MKMVTLSSLVVLFAIASMVAIAPSAFAAHHEVTIENAPGSSAQGCEPDCFIPSIVTVDLGTIVTWLNTDTAAHTATSGSPGGDDVGAVWDSSLIMNREGMNSFSYTTDTVGTFDYFCMVHPWMAGTLIVEDAAAAAADAAAAEAAAADAAAADAAAADAAAAEAAAAESLAALEASAAESLAAAEAAAAEAAAAEAAAVAKAEYKANNPPIDFTDTLIYSISSGSVSSITSNSDDATLVVAIDTSDDGELSINLDNDNITAFDDGSYFVLVNNEEVEFSQDGNDLTIPYEAGTEKIEIVASAVVPEFGTIAMIVLAVAIVSIIVLTTKTRTTLIPKL